MTSLEKTGKTVNDAINAALTMLGVTRDEVDIEILAEGSRGIFGFGAKPAKISATVKFNPEAIATKFLQEISRAMKVSVTTECLLKERNLSIELQGKDASVFIGKRGQTLDALQYITNLVVNKGEAPYINVSIDTANYRQKRKETLENLAMSLAKKVKQTKRKVVLEPMSSYERRIIHATLQNDRMIQTHSEGEEPYRNVVITLKH